MNNDVPNLTPPPPSFNGKWLIIVMVPLIIITSIWLIYLRVTLKQPTDVKPLPVSSTGASPSQTAKP